PGMRLAHSTHDRGSGRGRTLTGARGAGQSRREVAAGGTSNQAPADRSRAGGCARKSRRNDRADQVREVVEARARRRCRGADGGPSSLKCHGNRTLKSQENAEGALNYFVDQSLSRLTFSFLATL